MFLRVFGTFSLDMTDCNGIAFKVNGVPFKPECLTAAQAIECRHLNEKRVRMILCHLKQLLKLLLLIIAGNELFLFRPLYLIRRIILNQIHPVDLFPKRRNARDISLSCTLSGRFRAFFFDMVGVCCVAGKVTCQTSKTAVCRFRVIKKTVFLRSFFWGIILTLSESRLKMRRGIQTAFRLRGTQLEVFSVPCP